MIQSHLTGVRRHLMRLASPVEVPLLVSLRACTPAILVKRLRLGAGVRLPVADLPLSCGFDGARLTNVTRP